ncbi:hypothetical protein AMTR_s00031p00201440 [Amborella trichopoda]|uniref:Uncharacterized protein n=1 Tax=Amborella trichopoda TaxID=13333 RepID=U5D2D9_AMBTC|nr:hypothetical protein AMTR_s00031p00201440 [Amborella trichopoda]
MEEMADRWQRWLREIERELEMAERDGWRCVEDGCSREWRRKWRLRDVRSCDVKEVVIGWLSEAAEKKKEWAARGDSGGREGRNCS